MLPEVINTYHNRGSNRKYPEKKPFVLVIPSMIEEHGRRNQLMKNVPNDVLIHGLSKSLFGGSSWEKNDLDRIDGVELREDESTMCGFACMKYWNNRNVPTKFDDLRFYVFKNKRNAKAALSKIKENLGIEGIMLFFKR